MKHLVDNASRGVRPASLRSEWQRGNRRDNQPLLDIVEQSNGGGVMATYLETFQLPIDEESSLIAKRMWENGGPHGYIDNAYPCGIFGPKGLREV